MDVLNESPISSQEDFFAEGSDDEDFLSQFQYEDDWILSQLSELDGHGFGSPPAKPADLARIQAATIGTEQAGQQCTVCLEEFTEGQGADRLPCRHHFHSQCIREWLAKCGSCPLCRQVLSLADDSDNSDDSEEDQSTLSTLLDEIRFPRFTTGFRTLTTFRPFLRPLLRPSFQFTITSIPRFNIHYEIDELFHLVTVSRPSSPPPRQEQISGFLEESRNLYDNPHQESQSETGTTTKIPSSLIFDTYALILESAAKSISFCYRCQPFRRRRSRGASSQDLALSVCAWKMASL